MSRSLTLQKELARSISDILREVGGTKPSKQEILKNAESFAFLKGNLSTDREDVETGFIPVPVFQLRET